MGVLEQRSDRHTSEGQHREQEQLKVQTSGGGGRVGPEA